MNAHNKSVVSIIRNYENYLEFISEWQGYTFEQLSYSRWTVNEILIRIEESKSQPPLPVIEKFIEKIDEYSRLNDKSSFIFSIVRETAENIIDCLIS